MSYNKKICGLLGIAMKAGKLVLGTDACIEKIENNIIKLILVAKDASDRTKNKFKNKTDEFKVPYYEVSSIEEVSKSIGKNNKAVIGIIDKGFSKRIIEIINGGEEIG